MRLDIFGRQQEQESHLEQPGPSGKGIADIKGRALRTRGEIVGLLLRKAELRHVRPLTLLDMMVSEKATQC